MKTHFLRVALSLVLAAALVAAKGAPVADSHSSAPNFSRASHPGLAPVTSGSAVSRRIFVVAPVFVGPAFYDPFWFPAPYVTVQVVPMDVARYSLHVRPRKADVRVDGSDLGEARDYASGYHPLWLSADRHVLELRFPGYQTLRVRLDARKGQVSDLHYRLYPGNGWDRRSSD